MQTKQGLAISDISFLHILVLFPTGLARGESLQSGAEMVKYQICSHSITYVSVKHSYMRELEKYILDMHPERKEDMAWMKKLQSQPHSVRNELSLKLENDRSKNGGNE